MVFKILSYIVREYLKYFIFYSRYPIIWVGSTFLKEHVKIVLLSINMLNLFVRVYMYAYIRICKRMHACACMYNSCSVEHRFVCD